MTLLSRQPRPGRWWCRNLQSESGISPDCTWPKMFVSKIGIGRNGVQHDVSRCKDDVPAGKYKSDPTALTVFQNHRKRGSPRCPG